MEKTYEIGNCDSEISLSADIDTIGLAASRANVIKDGGATAVAESVDASGDIPTKNIGNCKSLKGSRLQVFTKISLTGSDAAQRAEEANRLSGTYTLDGGDGGQQTYPHSTKDYVDPNVFLQFLIDLV
jgi:hypothetical protein